MATGVHGSTGQNPINQIEQNSTPLVNASGVKEHKPPTFQEAVNKLKRGFNNLVLSHNKRVVARAYRSYKKSQTGGALNDSKVNIRGQRVNKGTINNTDFNEKALNPAFAKTLQGKNLKAFFKVFKSELLKTDNKTFFNNLPTEAQKAFIGVI